MKCKTFPAPIRSVQVFDPFELLRKKFDEKASQSINKREEEDPQLKWSSISSKVL